MEINGKTIGVAVGIVVLLVAGGPIWRFVQEVRVRSRAPALCTMPTKRYEGEPYLKGRVAFVNQDHKWDVLLGTYAPAGVAAKAPSEITSCVIVDWSWRAAGTYDVTRTQTRDGEVTGVQKSVALAKQQTCHVTVVDRTIGAIVAEADFAGRVADSIRSDGTGSDPTMGQKPIEEIERWLYALPRR